MMPVVLVIVAVIILLVAVLLFVKKPKANIIDTDELVLLKNEVDALRVALAKAEEKASGLSAEKENITHFLKEEKDRLVVELVQEREKLAQANQSLESARSYFKAQQEKLQEQKTDIEQTRQHFQREFENVAEKLLKEKSREFTDVNKLSIDAILNPLKENIKAFEDKVDKVYNMEAAERKITRRVLQ